MPAKKGGKSDEAENIKVLVRCRPLNSKERDAGYKDCIEMNLADGSIAVHHVCGDPDRWTFDAVISNAITQEDIFKRWIQSMIDSQLDGFNSTIFAYGQSGSGKTYTMAGDLEKEALRGIIPRSFDYIFNHIRAKSGPQCRYNVYCSYLELYNGQIRDLLVKDVVGLKIKENKDKTFFVQDLLQPQVKFQGDLFRHMEEGAERRKVASTELNQDSSRSHSIFTVYVQKEETTEDGDVRAVTSKLNLVDLAGSERQSKTGATGDTLKEGCNINLSLSALGTVIDTIVKGKGHIPYRSSPLTMLLKDSLGGGSKTCMFANINPSEHNISETVSTLRFADRAKQIKNKPLVQMDAKDQKIADLTHKVAELTDKLKRYESGDAAKLEDENEKLVERAGELEVELQALQEERERSLAEARERVDHAEAELQAAKEQVANSTGQHVLLVKEKEVLQRQVGDEAAQRLELSRIATSYIRDAGAQLDPAAECLETHEIQYHLQQLLHSQGGAGVSAEALSAAVAEERAKAEQDADQRVAKERSERDRWKEMYTQAQESLQKMLERHEKMKGKADAEKEKRKKACAEKDQELQSIRDAKEKERENLEKVVRELEDKLSRQVQSGLSHCRSGSFSVDPGAAAAPAAAGSQRAEELERELRQLRERHAADLAALEKRMQEERSAAAKVTAALGEPKEGDDAETAALREAVRAQAQRVEATSAVEQQLRAEVRELRKDLDGKEKKLAKAQKRPPAAAPGAAEGAPSETAERLAQLEASAAQLAEAAEKGREELAALELRLKEERANTAQLSAALGAPQEGDDAATRALREAVSVQADKMAQMGEREVKLKEQLKNVKERLNAEQQRAAVLDARCQQAAQAAPAGGAAAQAGGAAEITVLEAQARAAEEQHRKEVAALEAQLQEERRTAAQLSDAITAPKDSDDAATAALRDALRAQTAKAESGAAREAALTAELKKARKELSRKDQKMAALQDRPAASAAEGAPAAAAGSPAAAAPGAPAASPATGGGDQSAEVALLLAQAKESAERHSAETAALQARLERESKALEQLQASLSQPKEGDDPQTAALREAVRLATAKVETGAERERELSADLDCTREEVAELEQQVAKLQDRLVAVGASPAVVAGDPGEAPQGAGAAENAALEEQMREMAEQHRQDIAALESRLKEEKASASQLTAALGAPKDGDDAETAALREAVRGQTQKAAAAEAREKQLAAEVAKLREKVQKEKKKSAALQDKLTGTGKGEVGALESMLHEMQEQHSKDLAAMESHLKQEAAAAAQLSAAVGEPKEGDDAQTAALREAVRGQTQKAEAYGARVAELNEEVAKLRAQLEKGKRKTAAAGDKRKGAAKGGGSTSAPAAGGGQEEIAALEEQLQEQAEQHSRELAALEARMKEERANASQLTAALGAPKEGDDAETAALREAVRGQTKKVEAAEVREKQLAAEVAKLREKAQKEKKKAAALQDKLAAGDSGTARTGTSGDAPPPLEPAITAELAAKVNAVQQGSAGADAMRDCVAELAQKLESSEFELQKSLADCAAAAAARDRAERELAMLRDQQDGLRREAAAVEARNDGTLKQLEEDRQDAAAEATAAREDAERERQHAKELESKLGELLKQVEQFEHDMGKLRQQDVDWQKAMAEEKAAFAKYKQDSDGAAGQVQILQKTLDERSRALQDTREMVSSLQQVISELHAKEALALQERQKLEKDHEEHEARWRERLQTQEAQIQQLVQRRLDEAHEEHLKALAKKDEEIERMRKKVKKHDQAVQKVKERYDQKVVEHEDLMRQFEEHKFRVMERERVVDETVDNQSEIKRLLDESKASRAMQPGQQSAAAAARQLVSKHESDAAAAESKQYHSSPAARKFSTVRELAEQDGRVRSPAGRRQSERGGGGEPDGRRMTPPPGAPAERKRTPPERRPRKAEELERRVTPPPANAQVQSGEELSPQERAEQAMKRAGAGTREALSSDERMQDAGSRAQRAMESADKDKRTSFTSPRSGGRSPIGAIDPAEAAERMERARLRQEEQARETHPALDAPAGSRGAGPVPIQVKPTPRRSTVEDDHPAFRAVGSPRGKPALSPTDPASPYPVNTVQERPDIPSPSPDGAGSPGRRLSPVPGGQPVVRQVEAVVPEPPLVRGGAGAPMGLYPMPVTRTPVAAPDQPNMSMASILPVGSRARSTVVPGSFSPSPPPPRTDMSPHGTRTTRSPL